MRQFLSAPFPDLKNMFAEEEQEKTVAVQTAGSGCWFERSGFLPAVRLVSPVGNLSCLKRLGIETEKIGDTNHR
ncbi:hypothetical protein [Geobacillus thermoleovorans]|uniref:hypothetical protein n=1 Tax=Geobacillus thermoleovorans TaxID=33941 RepID=UPI002989E3E7|nr:hypothetical protein [Geobacillus thermoleovorans]